MHSVSNVSRAVRRAFIVVALKYLWGLPRPAITRVSLAVPPASERRTRSPLDRRVDNVGNQRLASPHAIEGLFLAPTNMCYLLVGKFAESCDESRLQHETWRIDTTLCCLGVEYATVQLLMPTNPEIHDRNALPGILD
jgi:hypothetical protein